MYVKKKTAKLAHAHVNSVYASRVFSTTHSSIKEPFIILHSRDHQEAPQSQASLRVQPNHPARIVRLMLLFTNDVTRSDHAYPQPGAALLQLRTHTPVIDRLTDVHNLTVNLKRIQLFSQLSPGNLGMQGGDSTIRAALTYLTPPSPRRCHSKAEDLRLGNRVPGLPAAMHAV
jgi:hypothetical protein